jgi:hypothetical protein
MVASPSASAQNRAPNLERFGQAQTNAVIGSDRTARAPGRQMIVIAEEGLQGAERRCRAATGIATAGPDDDRARLNLFQLAAAAGGMDGERAPALAAGRADHAVPLQHGADPQRVDGAHGAHGHSADFDLMFAGAVGERIGAGHPARAVEDHEIAPGEPLQGRADLAGGSPDAAAICAGTGERPSAA